MPTGFRQVEGLVAAMPIKPELRHHYQTPEWFAARDAARARSGDRCERCGLSNQTFVEKQRVGGYVRVFIQCGAAHLNGIAGDDRPENVAWLCRGCHLKHDEGQHRETRAIRKDLGRPILKELAG